jgi:hypothetical protein
MILCSFMPIYTRLLFTSCFIMIVSVDMLSSGDIIKRTTWVSYQPISTEIKPGLLEVRADPGDIG